MTVSIGTFAERKCQYEYEDTASWIVFFRVVGAGAAASVAGETASRPPAEAATAAARKFRRESGGVGCMREDRREGEPFSS
jgi:hypothetical protein